MCKMMEAKRKRNSLSFVLAKIPLKNSVEVCAKLRVLLKKARWM